MTSRIATKDCAVDLTARGAATKELRAELEHFLRPTKLLPTEGIVKAAATARHTHCRRVYSRQCHRTGAGLY